MARSFDMNFSTGGAICGSSERASLISSISKNRAPGICPASYSARTSRPSAAMNMVPSRTRRSGSFIWAASQSVETRVFGSSVAICAPRVQTLSDYSLTAQRARPGTVAPGPARHLPEQYFADHPEGQHHRAPAHGPRDDHNRQNTRITAPGQPRQIARPGHRHQIGGTPAAQNTGQRIANGAKAHGLEQTARQIAAHGPRN